MSRSVSTLVVAEFDKLPGSVEGSKVKEQVRPSWVENSDRGPVVGEAETILVPLVPPTWRET